MKKNNLLFTFLITIVITCSLLFQNCVTLIESKCNLDQFEGVYIGYYKVAGLVDISDTLTVVVDTAINKATIYSIKLDTFFVTNFLSEKSELRIDPIIIPYIEVFPYTFTEVAIAGGYLKLDGSCNDLFVEMNGITTHHNVPGFPNPLKNVKLHSPDYMIRQ
jgi:hypothetical protein